MNIFVITSAIGAELGIYSYEERLSQLLLSIESVRTHSPGSFICLYDISETQIPESDHKKLESLTDRYVSLTDMPYTQNMISMPSNDPNLTMKKTFGEMYIMLEFLSWLKAQSNKFDRVFKLSGRYQLTESFTKTDYALLKNSTVFSYKRDWFGDEVYTLRLWSFDFSLLDKMFDMFMWMNKFNIDMMVEHNKIRIIEYCVFKFINESSIPVHELSVVGIHGCHSQDGAEVNE